MLCSRPARMFPDPQWPFRGVQANGSVRPEEEDLHESERTARQRTRQASRAALRAASQRMRDVEEGKNMLAAGLEGVAGAFLDVAEGCLAFCWEVGPGPLCDASSPRRAGLFCLGH